MKINRLELYTSELQQLKSFYAQSLQLPLLEDTNHAFTVAAGNTELCFIAVQDESKPIYHFAFNIPENKIMEARDWLSARVQILTYEDEEIIHFAGWNAHSLYFLDPAGNIVELIARHNLANTTYEPFNQGQILCLSEIGMPVEDVWEQVEHFQVTMDIPPWRQPDSQFAPMGDEDGLLILTAVGRTWFMGNEQAKPYPMQVTFQANKNLQVKNKTYLFQLVKDDSGNTGRN